jgi:arylformamidase
MWPGAPPFDIQQQKIPLGKQHVVTVSHLKLIPHCGTHIDAPLHFDRNGDSIDDVDLGLLIGPCRVFEHKPRRHITRGDLRLLGNEWPTRLLIKTVNSRQLRAGKLGKGFISLLPDAMDEVIRRGVKVLGVDGFSIGPYGLSSDRNHVQYCGTGGLIIEMMDLSDVEPGDYFLVALPMKLQGAEAAPARVLLFHPHDTTAARLDACSAPRISRRKTRTLTIRKEQ